MDLSDVLAGAADGAFVIGPDGGILAWNRAAERILGHRATEILGRPCCEVLAGQDAVGSRVCKPACKVMTLAGEGSAADTFDMRAVTKTGRPIWLNVSTLTSRRGGRTLGPSVPGGHHRWRGARPGRVAHLRADAPRARGDRALGGGGENPRDGRTPGGEPGDDTQSRAEHSR